MVTVKEAYAKIEEVKYKRNCLGKLMVLFKENPALAEEIADKACSGIPLGDLLENAVGLYDSVIKEMLIRVDEVEVDIDLF